MKYTNEMSKYLTYEFFLLQNKKDTLILKPNVPYGINITYFNISEHIIAIYAVYCNFKDVKTQDSYRILLIYKSRMLIYVKGINGQNN